eukprot:6425681-Prymnesium_polylepis.3
MWENLRVPQRWSVRIRFSEPAQPLNSLRAQRHVNSVPLAQRRLHGRKLVGVEFALERVADAEREKLVAVGAHLREGAHL